MFNRLWKSLFTRPVRTRRRRPITRLRLHLQSLEGRDVPSATLNLTTAGASGSINGAIFRQIDAVSVNAVDPFVRLQGGGDVQQGYNTNARPLQFDEARSKQETSALLVSDLPLVTVNGVAYRVVTLDIDQGKAQPLLSLDALRVYVSNAANLSGYRAATGKLDGLAPVYDLDAGGNHWVLLSAKPNAGKGFGDMSLLLPDSLFKGKGKYIYLYSEFGVHDAGRNDVETWAVGPAPKASPAVGSISGTIFFDNNKDGVQDNGETVLANQTVYLDMNNDGTFDKGDISTTTNANGVYQFTNLPTGAGVSYTVLTSVPPSGWVNPGDPLVVDLTQPGQSVTGENLGLLPNIH